MADKELLFQAKAATDERAASAPDDDALTYTTNGQNMETRRQKKTRRGKRTAETAQATAKTAAKVATEAEDPGNVDTLGSPAVTASAHASAEAAPRRSSLVGTFVCGAH